MDPVHLVVSDGSPDEVTQPSSALLPMVECNEEDIEFSYPSNQIKTAIPSPVEKVDAEQQTDVGNGEINSCSKCQSVEMESQKALTQLTIKYETEVARV